MVRGILERFSIEVVAVAATPWVVWGWGGGGLHLAIQSFGINDFSLADRFVKDRVG